MAGINIKDLTVVNMSPADMIFATSRGDMDGFSWTREAAITADRQSGDMVTVMTQEGFEQVVKQQPDLLDAAVKSLGLSQCQSVTHHSSLAGRNYWQKSACRTARS
jgi:hypothetical protein